MYFATIESDLKHLRFDLNPTSTGFAAFPGLFINRVRAVAKLEALERWTIINWWLGKVRSCFCRKVKYKEGELSVYQLACDTNRFFVGLLHFQFTVHAEQKVNAFSFAAGPSLDQAIDRAKIELDRNINSLKRFLSNFAEVPTGVHAVEEARLLYFSTHEGLLSFQDKIRFSQHIVTDFSMLETVVDCEVIGEWSRYAKVWRYLYKNSHCDDGDHKFFFF